MRILIVAWGWPPISRIGSLRPLGMAREWTTAGHEVHVLTGPGDRGGEYTPDLVAAADESRAIVHRAPAPGIPRPRELRAAFDMDPSELVQKSTIPRWRQILAQWRTFPDYQRSWIHQAADLGKQLHRKHRFDVVWTTSPPESVVFVGRALARAGIPWVADFRDPWSDYALARWDPLSRWVINRISARVLSDADVITTNVEGAGRSLSRATRRDVLCIRNGFDPTPKTQAPVKPRTLGYFGRVYPDLHHPEHLWNPLRALRARGTPWTVEFYVSPGGSGAAHIDVPPDLKDLVKVMRPLPRPAALQEMATMAALLVLTLEPRQGDPSVPGKLYDYIGSGRPLLVSAPRGLEVRAIVEATGTGIAAWGDEETIAAFEAIERFEVSKSGRAMLSRTRSAAQMIEIFEHVLAGVSTSNAAGAGAKWAPS